MGKSVSMKKAAFINIISRYTTVIIQLVYQSILARLLTPNDYGIVAVITVFVNFFVVLADLGVGNAIIQNQNLDKEDIDSIFSWSIKISILLGVVFCILSIPISLVYSDSVYLIIGPLLAISVLFNALNMVPNALLQKKKQFFRIGVRQVSICVISSGITIVLAYIGWGYYSLVFYSILTAILNFAWNYYGSGLRIIRKSNPDSINKVKSFSMYLFGFNIINYFSRNIDTLLIGRFFGNSELGYYNKAYQLMLYPMNYLTNVITPVLMPFLAEHQKQVKYIYSQFIKTVKILSLLGIYITAFCFFSSRELIIIMYGEQWLGTISYFQILSITIWSQMICATSSSMFQILGQVRLQFIRVVILAVTIAVGVLFGVFMRNINIVAIMVMLSYISYFVTMLYFLIKLTFKIQIVEFLRELIPDFLLFIIVSAFLFVLGFLNIKNVVLSFFVKLIGSGIFYFIILVLSGQIRYFEAIIPKRIFNRFKRK